jgi:uncharacterized protein
MNRRFADTFFLIALLSERDEAHERALTYARDSSSKLVTTRWVLAEFADGYATTGYRLAAAESIQAIVEHPDSIVVPTTDEWFSRGLALYQSRPDKNWSLTDCISFLVMKEMEIQEALTADHHFEQAGFTALLKD